MSARTEPPFRADHVGSFLRPPEPLALRAKVKSCGQLDALDDECIRERVATQEEKMRLVVEVAQQVRG